MWKGKKQSYQEKLLTLANESDLGPRQPTADLFLKHTHITMA